MQFKHAIHIYHYFFFLFFVVKNNNYKRRGRGRGRHGRALGPGAQTSSAGGGGPGKGGFGKNKKTDAAIGSTPGGSTLRPPQAHDQDNNTATTMAPPASEHPEANLKTSGERGVAGVRGGTQLRW